MVIIPRRKDGEGFCFSPHTFSNLFKMAKHMQGNNDDLSDWCDTFGVEFYGACLFRVRGIVSSLITGSEEVTSILSKVPIEVI